MTLNQILYFRKVARLENYHQAAEELYISQPSLSRSMAALESELGITLFEKKGRGVVLTNAGRLFLEHADRIAGDCDIAAGKMKELASGGGKINIGYIFPLAGHYIPHNVRTFLDQEENKNVAFSFWQNHTPAIAQKVKSGELDLGFGGFLKRDDMEFFPLIQQPLVIVSPEQHPIADEPEVPLVKLTRYPVIGYDRASWMGAYTGHLYRKYQLHPNIIMECPDCGTGTRKLRHRAHAANRYSGTGRRYPHPHTERSRDLSSDFYVLDEEPLPASGCRTVYRIHETAR